MDKLVNAAKSASDTSAKSMSRTKSDLNNLKIANGKEVEVHFGYTNDGEDLLLSGAVTKWPVNPDKCPAIADAIYFLSQIIDGDYDESDDREHRLIVQIEDVVVESEQAYLMSDFINAEIEALMRKFLRDTFK